MNFLYPILFWGLLSLLIPILFHLWNKKQRNIVKIGSIKWIKTATANTNSLNLSLSDIPLLLLKLLILSTLTFLIVEPFYKTEEEKEFRSDNLLLVDQSFFETDILKDVYKDKPFQDTIAFKNIVDLEQILNNLTYQPEEFDSIFICAKNNIQFLPNEKIETNENIILKLIPSKENEQFCFEREGENYQYVLEDTIARYSDKLYNGRAFKINQTNNINFIKKENSSFANELFEIVNASSKFKMDSSLNANRFLTFDDVSEQNLIYKIVQDSLIIFPKNLKSEERQTELVKLPYLLTEFIFSQDTLNQTFKERDLRKTAQSISSIITNKDDKRQTRFREQTNTKIVTKSQFLTNYLWAFSFVLIALERIFSNNSRFRQN